MYHGIYRNHSDLSRVLRVVQRSKVPLNESLGSALVSGLAEAGRVTDVKSVVQQVCMSVESARCYGECSLSLSDQMQGRLRVQSQSSVLSLACQTTDVELALEYLARWDVLQPVPETVVQSLAALSRESGRPDLMEKLLVVVRGTRQSLGEESATELRLWAER